MKIQSFLIERRDQWKKRKKKKKKKKRRRRRHVCRERVRGNEMKWN